VRLAGPPFGSQSAQNSSPLNGLQSITPRPHLHAQRWSWSHHGSLDRSPSSGFSSAIQRSKDPTPAIARRWPDEVHYKQRDLSACCRIGDITVESTWFPRGAVFLIPNNQPGCLEPSVGCGPYGGFQSIRVPPLIMHFNRILIGFSIINNSFTHFGVALWNPPAAAPIQVTSLVRRRTCPAECWGPHP